MRSVLAIYSLIERKCCLYERRIVKIWSWRAFAVVGVVAFEPFKLSQTAEIILGSRKTVQKLILDEGRLGLGGWCVFIFRFCFDYLDFVRFRGEVILEGELGGLKRVLEHRWLLYGRGVLGTQVLRLQRALPRVSEKFIWVVKIDVLVLAILVAGRRLAAVCDNYVEVRGLLGYLRSIWSQHIYDFKILGVLLFQSWVWRILMTF